MAKEDEPSPKKQKTGDDVGGGSGSAGGGDGDDGGHDPAKPELSCPAVDPKSKGKAPMYDISDDEVYDPEMPKLSLPAVDPKSKGKAPIYDVSDDEVYDPAMPKLSLPWVDPKSKGKAPIYDISDDEVYDPPELSLPWVDLKSKGKAPISKPSNIRIPASRFLGDDFCRDIMQSLSGVRGRAPAEAMSRIANKLLSDNRGEEANNIPYIGDREHISSLSSEFQSGSTIMQAKIKLLDEKYAAIRRTKGDGNCFYRSFMYSFLEHLLETQDKAEIERILAKVEQCRTTHQILGDEDFMVDDYFSIFIEQLESIRQGTLSHEELLQRIRDDNISYNLVLFHRIVTSGEIRKRESFFEPFISGIANTTVEQFCKESVEMMGEESDHLQVAALSDALAMPIRVVNLDNTAPSGVPTLNHHDFYPEESNASDTVRPPPSVTLLYRPGHYDVLYPK